MGELTHLFEQGKIGGLEIKNRIVMAPMLIWGLVEPDGAISERGIDYYAERAKGGVGLITTGAAVTKPDLEYRRTRGMFRADNPDAVPRLKALVEAVHRFGAKLSIQLTPGAGRVIFPMAAREPVGPSVLPNVWDANILTRELKVKEIEALVRSFETAAGIVKEAGIDAVEVHAHEGYLIDQFMTSLWNKRQDRYGGDLEGRLRFPLEIVRAVKDGAGADFPVIFRYAGSHLIEGGREIEESLEIARNLESAGVDALHVDAGCYDDWYWPHPPGYQPPGCMADMAAAVRRAVGIPVIAVGRLGYPDLAEGVLRDGKADFIALGRPLLADPDWPIKAKEGRLDDIVPCIGCHDGCLGRATVRGAHLSCAVNPACGNEREAAIGPAERPKSVCIIGGGVAGMEAAMVAALRGHRVHLYEKGGRLGGHLIEASAPAFKDDLRWLRDYYESQLRKLDVAVELGTEATAQKIRDKKADVVIVATGSTPIVPAIPGMDQDRVATAVDVLLGLKKAGERVVVVGGGLVGCETAVHLAQRGRRVTVVEMLGGILPDLFEANRQQLLKMLAESGVAVLTDAQLARVTDEGAVIVNKRRRYQAHIKADTVVLAVGLKPETRLARDLADAGIEIHSIGDCLEPGKIIDAIWSAHQTARGL
ncbi:MAG: FAD-dependent oxidoreductase [Deltaproteobacteria bacterium]|nr:FAD-dependent oxidoreductase [Deltaproteobacteria bacterium]